MAAFIQDIARACYEANRVYCKSIGDHSQPAWKDAPEWQQQSAIAGVRFHLKNPEAGPSASHEEWMRVKLEDGWSYGPEKNPVLKQHPCMVPYEALPAEQRLKDELFIAIVRSL